MRSTRLSKYCHKFGAEVRRIRNDKGLTLQELAKLSELPEDYVERVENGEASPSHFARCKMSKVLDIDLEPIATKLYEKSGELNG